MRRITIKTRKLLTDLEARNKGYKPDKFRFTKVTGKNCFKNTVQDERREAKKEAMTVGLKRRIEAEWKMRRSGRMENLL